MALPLFLVLGGACAGRQPFVFLVQDQTGSLAQPTLSGLMGHRNNRYVMDGFSDQGMRVGPYTTRNGPDAMATRITEYVATYNPSMVVIQSTMTDTQDPTVYGNYAVIVDKVMGGVGNVPVVWMSPTEHNLVAPYSVVGAQAIDTALRLAEARWPALWAVSTQQVWEAAWGRSCPVKSPTTRIWELRPIAECYASFGVKVDLSLSGAQAEAIFIDAIVETQITLKAPRNQTMLVQQMHRNQA